MGLPVLARKRRAPQAQSPACPPLAAAGTKRSSATSIDDAIAEDTGGSDSDREEAGPAGVGGRLQRRSSVLTAHFPAWKKRVLLVINHRAFYWSLVVMTFFVIFVDDVKKACLPVEADAGLEITTTAIFVAFVVEMGEARCRRRAAMPHARSCDPQAATKPGKRAAHRARF